MDTKEIRKLERGETNPRIGTLERIARDLGYKIEYNLVKEEK
jgi:transcriptional regulator with XRE-family HTH domain